MSQCTPKSIRFSVFREEMIISIYHKDRVYELLPMVQSDSSSVQSEEVRH